MNNNNDISFILLVVLFSSFLSYSTSILGQDAATTLNHTATEISTADHLKYIGMPVGGIHAGQVYLGGDGQLWYWDIFNIQRIQAGGPGDKFYLNPLTQDNRFEQGFALRLKDDSPRNITPTVKLLRSGGFRNIHFRGEYPIGKVSYEDADFPISVQLNAFSPFIPTDHESSDFPAVVMEYTLKNNTQKPVTIELIGWLQNMANLQTASLTSGNHHNEVIKKGEQLQLYLFSKGSDTDLPDYGNITLTLVEGTNAWGIPNTPAEIKYNLPELRVAEAQQATAALGEILTGAIGKEITLQPTTEQTITFILSWYFPNLHRKESGFHHLRNKENLRHYYSSKFTSSLAVADRIVENKEKYLGTTKLWNATWYDASLPNWFLDRTFLNTSTLATTSCYRLDDLTNNPVNEGRFYTMEGVYLGHGTCTHVFHYEQAFGRVFPALARQLRTQVDYGLSFQGDGSIGYRGELSDIGRHDGRGYAVDGHAGTILRAYREHTTSVDHSFLKSFWPKIKKSIEYMIAHDAEKTGKPDGILEGIQYNTLDRMWFGKISWISGMYNAALRAGEAMAKDIKDEPFEKKCRQIAKLGYEHLSKELFNGEYFIQIPDPEHPEAPNTNAGCHADQLLGQYWASQTGLPNIVPTHQIKEALRSIVKYNFHSTYGKYLDTATIKVSRYYALPKEPAMVTCSFPKGGAHLAPGKVNNEWEKLVVGYFSEPWTGQEHQIAATLISQGLVEEGLMIEQAVHHRYSPEKRNPYNEIEYGNHYTRAMSSFAPFIAALGFTYNGPKGIIGFDPKIEPEEFKSAFIAGTGWGTFSQKKNKNRQSVELAVKFGALSLNTIRLQNLNDSKRQDTKIMINGKPVVHKVSYSDSRLTFSLKPALELRANDQLIIEILNK